MIKYSINNWRVILFFLVVMLFGGVAAFDQMGKKEDAPFVIKQALVFVNYPGATALEVEDKITRVVERKLQTMPLVYKISSDSYHGMAKISVELQPYTPADQIEQIWDILRRKMLSVQAELPPQSWMVINDDFGDVFGIYMALVASEGFTYEDLRVWSKEIERPLSTLSKVSRVMLFGNQPREITITVPMSKLAALKLTPSQIRDIISSQNREVEMGNHKAGDLDIIFYSDGLYRTVEDLKEQIVISKNGGEIKLGDIAQIKESYSTPATTFLSVNGQKAIGVAIASPSNRDVVATGERVAQKLELLESKMEVGLSIESLYREDIIAHKANNGFLLNLVESVAIVILILMIAMGFRSSILIGSSLLFSISGTMMIMQFLEVGLNRTSLAGFIIAMGMLVDNAIVVADNSQNNLRKGMKIKDAVTEGATRPMLPLLGATLIAIFSFLPLYTAKASVAEIVQPLFVVIGVSLLLSWLLALTQTTSFATKLYKEPTKEQLEGQKPLYSGKFYSFFGSFLSRLISLKFFVVLFMVFLLMASVWVMGILPQNFFPSLDKEYFRAEYFLPNGYSIYDTQSEGQKLEKWLLEQPSVKKVSIAVGSSPPRYYLASSAFGPMPTYGSILVELTTKDSTAAVEERFNRFAQQNFPNLVVKSSLFKLSPVPEANIEIGFIGDNIDTLTLLTSKVKEIMNSEPLVDRVRDSWGNKILMVDAKYSDILGSRAGVTRQMMTESYAMVTEGVNVGSFSYDDGYIPIKLKDSESRVFNLNDIANIPLISNQNDAVSLSSVSESIKYSYQYWAIRRFNHSKIMYAQCEPKRGANSGEAFANIYEKVVENIEITPGYSLHIKGERESQAETNSALAKNMPLTLILIFVTLLLLFRGYKKPVILLVMTPMIFIGVVLGLLVTGKMFDFFSILGLLGLIGMNIKNGIVLLEQIDIEKQNGLVGVEAVVTATKSRLLPVVLASGTTILGMIPLLFDAMFGGMAATIMGGLFVATLLTVVVLPVLYSIAYRIKL